MDLEMDMDMGMERPQMQAPLGHGPGPHGPGPRGPRQDFEMQTDLPEFNDQEMMISSDEEVSEGRGTANHPHRATDPPSHTDPHRATAQPCNRPTDPTSHQPADSLTQRPADTLLSSSGWLRTCALLLACSRR